jgi:hypothetical protein
MIGGVRECVDHVQAIGTDFQRCRFRPAPQWLHQMRSDLGRLAAEILQVGPFLARKAKRLALPSALGDAAGAVIYCP